MTKKEILVFIILVVIGIPIISSMGKYDKEVFTHRDLDFYSDTTYTASERQGEIHLYGEGTDGGKFRTLPSANEDTTEYYWTAPATDVYGTSLEQYLILSVEDTTQFTGDEIVYLGTETVIDSTWTESAWESPFDDEPSGDILLSHRTHYLNLRINGTDYRIAMKEIRGKLCK